MRAQDSYLYISIWVLLILMILLSYFLFFKKKIKKAPLVFSSISVLISFVLTGMYVYDTFGEGSISSEGRRITTVMRIFLLDDDCIQNSLYFGLKTALPFVLATILYLIISIVIYKRYHNKRVINK